MLAEIENTFIDDLFVDLENDKLVLPTLPEIALKVRETIEDPDASLADVAKVVSEDASISARLIQVANSPLIRASRVIDTIEGAVTRMGNNMVRNLVTGMAMEQMFQATSEVTDRRLRNIWQHSKEVAAISHILCSMYAKRLQPDQALLAGLVHDIGALPILTRAEDYPELLEDEVGLDHIIARTHATIGAAILYHWKFQPEMTRVVEEHENLDYQSEGSDPDYVDIVLVANLQSISEPDHHLAEVDWSTVPAFAKLDLATDINVVDMDEAGENIEAARAALA